MSHYTSVKVEGTAFATTVLKQVFGTPFVDNANRDESVEEAARLVVVTKPKAMFDSNGKIARPTRELVGSRMRSYVPGEFSGVEFKMTHSDRVNGEPSEFERLSYGNVRYFIQVYANNSYVLVDVKAMREAGLFTSGYNVVEGTSNGGSFKYAEVPLRTLAKAGVIVSASDDIKGFFGL